MTTRSPLARDEYDRVPENSGSDAPQKNGLRHLPRKVVGVLAAGGRPSGLRGVCWCSAGLVLGRGF